MSRYKRKYLDNMIKNHTLAAASFLAAAVMALAYKQMDHFVIAANRAREELESAKYWDEIRKNKLRVK